MNKLLAGLVLLAAPLAYAGSKQPQPVIINLKGPTASGSMGTARTSADISQMMACYSNAYAGAPQYNSAGCTAVDAKAQILSCFTRDPDQIRVIQSASGDAYVSFSVNPDGTCWYVNVNNGSLWDPK